MPIYEQCRTVFSCFLEDAWELVDKRSITFAIVFWIAAMLIAYARGKRRHIKRMFLSALNGSLVTLAGVGLLLIGVILGYAPYKRYENLKNYAVTRDQEVKKLKEYYDTTGLTVKIKQLKDQINALNQTLEEKDRRINHLANRVPPPRIDGPQRNRVEEALRRIGAQRILIKYLDVPGARARVYAELLADIFDSASWHVRLKNIKNKDEIIKEGIMIRTESGVRKPPPVVKAIQDAFSGVLSIGDGVRGDDRVNDIELEIGEM